MTETKGVQRVKGIRDIGSTLSVGVRSIPKTQRSMELELYMMKREKDRLEKEIFVLDKRKGAADRQLNGLTERIGKIQREEVCQKRTVKTHKDVPTMPLKKMAINY